MTQKVNLRNMQKNKAYEFDDNSYIWKVDRRENQEGNYSSHQAYIYRDFS